MRSTSGLCLAIFAFAALGASSPRPAAAQSNSVKAIFEKHDLIGTFAFDCGKPVGKDNVYFVNRVLDEGHVQRDEMSGPTTRDWVTIIDRTVELTSDEILAGGTRDGVPTETIYRLEANRARGVESSLGGKKLIAGAKFVGNGREVPWLQKCAAAGAQAVPAQSPPAIAPAGSASSVKAVFEKYNLLGIFAPDCSKPPKAVENFYYVDRLIDDNHVQRDVMEGDTARTVATIIDRAWEMGPTRVGLSGTRTTDGKPSSAIWRIDGNRHVQWEVVHDGTQLVAEGKWVKTGRDMPWITRCGDLH